LKQLRLQTHSLAEYFSIIEAQPAGGRHLFRGQANAAWPLVPSIYRTHSIFVGRPAEQNYESQEWVGIHRFFDEGLPYLPNLKRGPINDRILAQHFGVPTRLLDWTYDPLVALFFAVEDRRVSFDAAVFMLLPDGGNMNPEHIRNANTYKAIAIDPPAIDRRIPAQKSVFTWHPYGPPNEPFVPIDQRPDMGNQVSNGPGHSERGFAKITIPSAIRPLLRGQLMQMGIDRRNLFPGLDGVGAFIADSAIWT